jgi:hypothetical protein
MGILRIKHNGSRKNDNTVVPRPAPTSRRVTQARCGRGRPAVSHDEEAAHGDGVGGLGGGIGLCRLLTGRQWQYTSKYQFPLQSARAHARD